MGESLLLERDPVYDVTVDGSTAKAVHCGGGYAFCTQQCRERASAKPGLYAVCAAERLVAAEAQRRRGDPTQLLRAWHASSPVPRGAGARFEQTKQRSTKVTSGAAIQLAAAAGNLISKRITPFAEKAAMLP
jgi:YHS domain-containing protein